MSSSDHHLDFDVAVVGGGIVGCAVLRYLSLRTRLRCVMLEKEEQVLTGASGGNSAILHEPAEEDGVVNPIELRCVSEGSREARELLRVTAPHLPFRSCGALVVAWDEEQRTRLAELQARALKNGVSDAQLLSPQQVAEREPLLAAGQLGALLVPGETVMDSWWLASFFLLQALSNGASL